MEEFLDYVIENIEKLCITKEDQFLLYIKTERSVGKNREIHTLEMSFILLNSKNELMLSAPMGCAAEGIKKSTMHISLSISTCNVKCLCTNLNVI